MSEVVDVLVLHRGPLRLPLGGEGDAGRPLVQGPVTGLLLTGAQPEHVTREERDNMKMCDIVTTMAIRGQGSGHFVW